MTANCASMRGEQSTFAPTSTTTTGVPLSVGKADASAGRSTPGSMPCTILAVAITAPVLPADTTPCGDAIANQPRGHADGAVALGANRLGGAVLHGDLFAGVLDFDGQIADVLMLRQFLREQHPACRPG